MLSKPTMFKILRRAETRLYEFSQTRLLLLGTGDLCYVDPAFCDTEAPNQPFEHPSMLKIVVTNVVSQWNKVQMPHLRLDSYRPYVGVIPRRL